jgi:hypothetical protein
MSTYEEDIEGGSSVKYNGHNEGQGTSASAFGVYAMSEMAQMHSQARHWVRQPESQAQWRSGNARMKEPLVQFDKD